MFNASSARVTSSARFQVFPASSATGKQKPTRSQQSWSDGCALTQAGLFSCQQDWEMVTSHFQCFRSSGPCSESLRTCEYFLTVSTLRGHHTRAESLEPPPCVGRGTARDPFAGGTVKAQQHDACGVPEAGSAPLTALLPGTLHLVCRALQREIITATPKHHTMREQTTETPAVTCPMASKQAENSNS